MQSYHVAILGATGAVGREMIRVLEERQFPVKTLLPLSSSRSAGEKLSFCGEEVEVRKTEPAVFRGVDLVLGAAGKNVAEAFAPAIRASGAVFVDNSSAFRLQKEVPLVVPEVNPEDAQWHQGIIANPNCTTIITVTAIQALRMLSPIQALQVSTYQAASGAGAAGPVELQWQAEAFARGEPMEANVFAHPLAYNVIPQIGQEQEYGYTSEEMKLQYEGRKILHIPDLRVSCTCVRVPVMRSHSVSVCVRLERPISVEQAKMVLAKAPGCCLLDDLARNRYPMPLYTAGQDLVYVGRVRPDIVDPNGIVLWCCGDQLRKGAATNAVQIAELLAQS